MDLGLDEIHGVNGRKLFIEIVMAFKEDTTADSISYVLNAKHLSEKEKLFVAYGLGKINGATEVMENNVEALKGLYAIARLRELSQEELEQMVKDNE